MAVKKCFNDGSIVYHIITNFLDAPALVADY